MLRLHCPHISFCWNGKGTGQLPTLPPEWFVCPAEDACSALIHLAVIDDEPTKHEARACLLALHGCILHWPGACCQACSRSGPCCCRHVRTCLAQQSNPCFSPAAPSPLISASSTHHAVCVCCPSHRTACPAPRASPVHSGSHTNPLPSQVPEDLISDVFSCLILHERLPSVPASGRTSA